MQFDLLTTRPAARLTMGNERRFTMHHLVFLTFLLCTISASAQDLSTNINIFDTIPFIPDHGKEMRARFAAQPVTNGRTIFLGNSITEMGDWKTLTGDTTVLNRGIGGDITYGVLDRLDEVIRHRPDVQAFIEHRRIHDRIRIEVNRVALVGKKHRLRDLGPKVNDHHLVTFLVKAT